MGHVFRILLACLLAVCASHVAAADLSSAHTRLIEGRLANQFQATRLKAEEEAEARRELYDIPDNGNFRQMARAAARRYSIPPDLFEKLVTAESNWNPKAVSHAGAIGLAQLMPATARTLGVDPWNPRENLEGGARFLSTQFRRFRTWELALAAYNAGPGAVEQYGGIPPYRETQGYVKKILGR